MPCRFNVDAAGGVGERLCLLEHATACQLDTQQTKQHLNGGVCELRVVLEAIALEILHQVVFAVSQALLRFGFGDREAENWQATLAVPGLHKDSGYREAGLGDVARGGLGSWVGSRRGS